MHADGGEPDRIERVINLIPLQRGGTPEEVAASIVNQSTAIVGICY